MGVEMGRESDLRRCGRDSRESWERTRPRTGVGDARGRKGSDLGECEWGQQRKGG